MNIIKVITEYCVYKDYINATVCLNTIFIHHFSRLTDEEKRVFAFTSLLSKQKGILNSKCIPIYIHW
jgi:hypothetical protein